MSTTAAPTTLSEPIFASYLTRQQYHESGPETQYNFRKAAARLEAWLRENGLDAASVSGDDMRRYFFEMDYAPSTKRQHYTQLKAAFKYAWERGVRPDTPMADVRAPKIPQRLPVVVPNHHLRQLLQRCPDDLTYTLVNILVFTGMRRHEVSALYWEDVNLRAQMIRVIGKNDKERQVPIHPKLGEVIGGQRWVMGKRVLSGCRGGCSTATIDKRIAKLTDREFAPHDFRRTVATSLDDNECLPSVRDAILGWSPGTVFGTHYRHISTKALHNGIRKLYADDPVYVR